MRSYPYRYQNYMNSKAWAIGTVSERGSFSVRRVVWGQLLAREEKRPGERILRCVIQVIPPRGKTEKV